MQSACPLCGALRLLFQAVLAGPYESLLEASSNDGRTVEEMLRDEAWLPLTLAPRFHV